MKATIARVFRLLIIAGGLLPGAALADAQLQGATTYRVGPGCTYATIQAAINAIPIGGSGIIRVRGGLYLENLNVLNRHAEIIGGHPDCTSTAPSGYTTIEGTASSQPVLRIDNFNAAPPSQFQIYLARLNIQYGTGGTFGGGIEVRSRHEAGQSAVTNVELNNTWVLQNQAAAGAGISLRNEAAGGNGGLLILSNNSQIFNNQASSSGGGIHCRGNFVIRMTGGAIRNNTAGATGSSGARGGGVYLEGCNLNWFSSIAGDGEAALRNNTVHGRGGGLYAEAGSQVHLRGALFPLIEFSARPLTIRDNRTFNGDGGAFYLTGTDTRLRVDRSWIHDNISAWQGGAIFAGAGARAEVERAMSACHSKTQCSRLFNNQALAGSGGAVFAHGAGTAVTIRRTILSYNQAGTAASAAALISTTGASLTLADSLMYGTHGPRHSFSVNAATLRLERSTIADTSPAISMFRLNGTAQLVIFDSIVHDAGNAPMVVVPEGSPMVVSDCVIWHSDTLTNLGTHVRTLVADPRFANRAQGQYYLAPGSPAINRCPFAPPAPAVDLEWNPRGLVHSGQPVVHGPYDIGAYEYPLRLFRDRFEQP